MNGQLRLNGIWDAVHWTISHLLSKENTWSRTYVNKAAASVVVRFLFVLL